VTSIEPSPRATIPVEDDFTDIELAELEDFADHRTGNGGPGFEPVSDANIEATTDPAPAADRPPADATDAAEPADSNGPAATAQLHEANTIAAELRSHADNLGQLDDAELTDHVEYYQQAHGALQRALSDINTA
jgi:hypothetical protein